ncbi:MAG: hypothetical protein ACYC3X_08485 [Pirellulaceae bacterium]
MKDPLSGEDLAILETVGADGIGLRLAFCRLAGRIAHRVALVLGSELHWLLASVEGDERQAFPPSPPLQQLAFTELGGGRRAALLIGMAGRNHWSLSAEAGADERLIRWEVACRAPQADCPALGSVYQMLGSWQLSADADSAVVAVDRYRCCLRPLPCPGSDRAALLSVQRDRLAVFPPALADVSTHRWQYELLLAHGVELGEPRRA